jgi:hypothetical protein
MDEREVIDYILETFEGVETSTGGGYLFFFVGAERMLPFVTLANADNEHDSVSNLDRTGVYRLNLGIGPESYDARLGAESRKLGTDALAAEYDLAALDRLMPHPHYAPQSWVCILNPSAGTFEETVKPLLQEAYDRAAARMKRKAGG